MIKINNGFDTLLDASGKVLEVAPKLYDDAIQPSAQEAGKTLSLIPRAINAAFVPLRRWIAYKEYSMAETEKLLAEKLKNLEPEKIVPPEPYVAVPALQAISYSKDNEKLRNLYANLLSKSMNIDTKDRVHPSFVEIIKQLSPFDAILLKKIADTKETTLGIVKTRLILSETDESGLDWIKHIINPLFGMNISNNKEYEISLENLERLKLLKITYDTFLVDDSEYIPIENGDICTYCKEHGPRLHDIYKTLKIKRGKLSLTSFGKEFIYACVI